MAYYNSDLPVLEYIPILNGERFSLYTVDYYNCRAPFHASLLRACLLLGDSHTKTLSKAGPDGALPSKCARVEALFSSFGPLDRQRKGNDAAIGATPKDLIAATLEFITCAYLHCPLRPFVPSWALSAGTDRCTLPLNLVLLGPRIC